MTGSTVGRGPQSKRPSNFVYVRPKVKTSHCIDPATSISDRGMFARLQTMYMQLAASKSTQRPRPHFVFTARASIVNPSLATFEGSRKSWQMPRTLSLASSLLRFDSLPLIIGPRKPCRPACKPPPLYSVDTKEPVFGSQSPGETSLRTMLSSSTYPHPSQTRLPDALSETIDVHSHSWHFSLLNIALMPSAAVYAPARTTVSSSL
mmetsp:Transcript_22748/g.37452  ORF Transcript_22748/g.37452 Transcript_22748/m.37452 type:complete len:206 (-) Transcript_22748:27-644(-)